MAKRPFLVTDSRDPFPLQLSPGTRQGEQEHLHGSACRRFNFLPEVMTNVWHSQERKKADVAEHPKVFHHVGLPVNEPPGTAELLSI